MVLLVANWVEYYMVGDGTDICVFLPQLSVCIVHDDGGVDRYVDSSCSSSPCGAAALPEWSSLMAGQVHSRSSSDTLVTCASFLLCPLLARSTTPDDFSKREHVCNCSGGLGAGQPINIKRKILREVPPLRS